MAQCRVLLVATLALIILSSCGSSTSPSAQPTVIHTVTPTTNSQEQGRCNSTTLSSHKGVWNVTCSTDSDHYVVNFDTTQSAPVFTIQDYTTLQITTLGSLNSLTGKLDPVLIWTFTGRLPELALYWDSTTSELRLYELPANILLGGGKHCSVPEAKSTSC